MDAGGGGGGVVVVAFVIAQASAIGGADFAEERAAFGHDVWNAETVANFDQFAAGDDDFGGFRERIEDEKNRGCVVVDYDGGFGAHQVREQFVRVGIALAALTARRG